MCLAVPAQLVSCEGNEALADLHGNQVRVSTILVPEATVGDWVLLHAGFAIQRLDAKEARETWALLRDIAAIEEEVGSPKSEVESPRSEVASPKSQVESHPPANH